MDAGGIPADVYADFIREFTPRERVEVAIVATAMGMLNKLNDGVDNEATGDSDKPRSEGAARVVGVADGMNGQEK